MDISREQFNKIMILQKELVENMNHINRILREVQKQQPVNVEKQKQYQAMSQCLKHNTMYKDSCTKCNK